MLVILSVNILTHHIGQYRGIYRKEIVIYHLRSGLLGQSFALLRIFQQCRNVALFQSALLGKEFKPVSVKGMMAGCKLNRGVAGQLFIHAGHKHTRRAHQSEIIAVYAGSCERSYNRLFHARPRHPGIMSDGHPDVSRVLSQTLNQPYGKTVGDGGNRLIGKRNRHILYALERNSADIASAFEFLPLFVKHVFHRSLKIL